MPALITSFWKMYRIIFVILFLYLVGDVFYRWDGFRYYGSFYEFVPSIALISILWCILAALTTLVFWLTSIVITWFAKFVSKQTRVEHVFMLLCFFVVTGALLYVGKKFGVVHSFLVFRWNNPALYFGFLGPFILTWFFRNQFSTVQERIAPLVWIFSILIIFSVPVLAYHTLQKQTDPGVAQTLSDVPETDNNRPNILLVTFDALSSENMSVYGYHRDTTPFISEWAKGATIFTRLEAEGNWTPPTVASIMTGKRIWTHKVYQAFSNKIDKGNVENLPLLMKQNGYYTMAYNANSYASPRILGISDGFDINYSTYFFRNRKNTVNVIEYELSKLFAGKILMFNWITLEDFIFTKVYQQVILPFERIARRGNPYKGTNLPPEIAFNKFLNDIDQNVSQPFFAWIHLYPPHSPYTPPEPFVGMYDPSPKLRTPSSLEKEKLRLERLTRINDKSKLDEVLPAVDAYRARYDEFIRYCDKQFEEFIAKFEASEISKNTVVILSSDHGESFTHYKIGHGDKYLHEQLTRIPLIIKGEKIRKGQVINDVAEQIDIPATILDLCDIPIPSWMEGRSLEPFLNGKQLPLKPAISMSFEQNLRENLLTEGTIAVWDNNYKLVHYIATGESMLFNLDNDPEEQNNLYSKEHEIGQGLLSLVQDKIKDVNDKLRKDR